MVTLLLSSLIAAAPQCPAGQAITADTAGQCCWSGQVWSKLQKRCVGVPACPGGMRAEAESCIVDCPAGQSVSEDTAGHCCWSNQVWSSSRAVCVGLPSCPSGLVAQGETCVAAAAPPPQYAAPPPVMAQPQPPPVTAQPQVAAPADAPRVEPQVTTERSKLRAELIDLKQRHAAIGVAGNVVMLVLGIPAIPLGIGLLAAGIEGNAIGYTLLGIFVTAIGGTFTLIGLIEVPAKVSRKAALSRQIRATEDRLNALGPGAQLVPLQGVLLSMSSPVFEF